MATLLPEEKARRVGALPFRDDKTNLSFTAADDTAHTNAVRTMDDDASAGVVVRRRTGNMAPEGDVENEKTCVTYSDGWSFARRNGFSFSRISS